MMGWDRQAPDTRVRIDSIYVYLAGARVFLCCNCATDLRVVRGMPRDVLDCQAEQEREFMEVGT